MPIDDIGYIIFVEVLRMTQYPGSPFTGEIIRDLIMFLFIPSVFIIFFVFFILNRLFGMEQTKFRLLFGIALYLFIVAGGYYPMFAYFAGPYFIFLLLIIGAIFFIPTHFYWRRARAGGAASGDAARISEEALHHLPPRLQGLIVKPALNPRERAELERYKEGLNNEIDRLQKRYDELIKKGQTRDLGQVALELTRKESERNMIDKALGGGI